MYQAGKKRKLMGKVVAFMLSFTMVLAMMPMGLVTAAGGSIVIPAGGLTEPIEVFAGDRLEVLIQELPGIRDIYLRSGPGATFGGNNFRAVVGHGTHVTRAVPNNPRNATAERLTLNVPAGLDAIVHIDVRAHTAVGSSFSIDMMDGRVVVVTIIERPDIRTPIYLRMRQTAKTIYAQGGETPELPLRIIIGDAINSIPLILDDGVATSPTVIPGAADVIVYYEGHRATPWTATFDANPVVSVTAVPQIYVGFTSQSTNSFRGTINVLDATAGPGSVSVNIVESDFHYLDGTPVPHTHTVANWARTTESADGNFVWRAVTNTIAGFPDLILELVVRQIEDAGNINHFVPASHVWNHGTVRYFTNLATPNTATFDDVWSVVNDNRAGGVNTAGLDYRIVMMDNAISSRSDLLGSPGFTESFELIGGNQIRLTVTQNNPISGFSNEIYHVFNLANPVARNEVSGVAFAVAATAGPFFVGMPVAGIADLANFDATITMSDGLDMDADGAHSHAITFAGEGLFTQPDRDYPFTGVLLPPAAVFFGATARRADSPTATPVEGFIRIPLDADRLVGTFSVDSLSATALVVDVDGDGAATIAPNATITISTATPTPAAIVLNYTAGDFVGTVPADTEGTFRATAATGFTRDGAPVNATVVDEFNYDIDGIDIDNWAPRLTYSTTNTQIILTVQDYFLDADNILTSFVANPTLTSVPEVVEAMDGTLTLTWTRDADWDGTITVTDPAGNDSYVEIDFAFGVSPVISGINIIPNHPSPTVTAVVVVNNDAAFLANSFRVLWQVFDDAMEPEEEDALDPLALLANPGDWTLNNGLIIPQIARNGYLYVIVFGTIEGILTPTHAISSVLIDNIAGGPSFGGVAASSDGTTEYADSGTFEFYVLENYPRTPTGLIRELWYAVVDIAVWEAADADTPADVRAFISGLPPTANVTRLVDNGLLQNNTMAEGRFPGTSVHTVQVNRENSVVVVYAQSTVGFHGPSLGSAFIASPDFDMIVNPTFTYTLNNPTAPFLNEWANPAGPQDIEVDVIGGTFNALYWRAEAPDNFDPDAPVNLLSGWTRIDAPTTGTRVNIPFDTDGELEIWIIATSSIGLPVGIPYHIATAMLDRTVPTVSPSPQAVAQTVYDSVSFTIGANDIHSGVAEFRFAPDNGPVDWEDADYVVAEEVGLTTLTFTPQADVRNYLVVAVDNVGNRSATSSITIPALAELSAELYSFTRGGTIMDLADNAPTNRVAVGSEQQIVVTVDIERDQGRFGGGAAITFGATAVLYDSEGEPVAGFTPTVLVTPNVLDPLEAVATITFSFEDLDVDGGNFNLVITPTDDLGTRYDENVTIYITYVDTAVTVTSIAFTANRLGIQPATNHMFGAFALTDDFADNFATVRFGDEINVVVEFYGEPVYDTVYMSIVGDDGDAVRLTTTNGTTFTGTLVVCEYVVTVVAPDTSSTDVDWIEMFEVDGIFWIVNSELPFALTNSQPHSIQLEPGFSYIMFELNFEDSMGIETEITHTTGYSVSGMEPELEGEIAVSSSVPADFWNGVFGIGLLENANADLIFKFTTNTPITPVFDEPWHDDFIPDNLYDNVLPSIGTFVEFSMSIPNGTGDPDVYTFIVNLNDFDPLTGLFAAGAASLTYDVFRSFLYDSYDNTLTIPMSLFLNGFVNEDGETFDFRNAGEVDIDIDFTLILMSMSGVVHESNVYDSSYLSHALSFVNVEASVALLEDGNIDTPIVGVVPIVPAEFDAAVLAAFQIPASGTRTLRIADASNRADAPDAANTRLFHTILTVDAAESFFENPVFPAGLGGGWAGGGAFGATALHFDRPISANADGNILIVASRSWTGYYSFFAVRLESVASGLEVAMTNVSNGVRVSPALAVTATFSSVAGNVDNPVTSIVLSRSYNDGAFAESEAIVLPTIGDLVDIVVNGVTVGTIQQTSAGTFVVTIIANGVYRISASNDRGVRVTTVFEV